MNLVDKVTDNWNQVQEYIMMWSSRLTTGMVEATPA